MDDELIDAIAKHGFVFWVCPNKCKGIVKWNKSKTEAVCMECGTKLTEKRHLPEASTGPDDSCPKGGKHEWGIDGAHNNEFCKKCFISRPDKTDACYICGETKGYHANYCSRGNKSRG